MIILSLVVCVLTQGSAGRKGGRGQVGAPGIEVRITQSGA